MKGTGLTACAALALGFALTASARTGEVGIDLGVAAVSGWHGFNPADRLAVRGGVHLTPHVEAEGELATHDYGGSVRGWMLSANVLLDFRPAKRVMPYLRAGIGYSKQDSLLGSNDRNGAVEQLGVGSRYWLGDAQRVALRTELLYVVLDQGGADSDALLGEIGVVFRLGKDVAKPAT